LFYIEFLLEMIFKNTNEHHVTHYYFTGWPDFSVVDQRKLLDLIDTVNRHGQNALYSKTQAREALVTPLVVHCRYKSIKSINLNLYCVSF
jgi:protein tyrosine phosphatase